MTFHIRTSWTQLIIVWICFLLLLLLLLSGFKLEAEFYARVFIVVFWSTLYLASRKVTFNENMISVYVLRRYKWNKMYNFELKEKNIIFRYKSFPFSGSIPLEVYKKDEFINQLKNYISELRD